MDSRDERKYFHNLLSLHTAILLERTLRGREDGLSVLLRRLQPDGKPAATCCWRTCRGATNWS